MAKSIIVKSDYSNKNNLQILQNSDGDIVISTYIRDPIDQTIRISLSGSRINHNVEIIQLFNKMIELLSDGSESDDVVRVI